MSSSGNSDGIIQGWVFDIQRFCVHDGPGIRTSVFLQGCPLRCRWCHNPEGLRQGAMLAYTSVRCHGCGRCVEVCPVSVHSLDHKNGHELHRGRCTACGRCVEACPSRALDIVGRQMTVVEVMDVVREDLPFYQDSGGGITLSGGEPLFQPVFSLALLKAARAESIGTCVETSGMGAMADMLAMAGFVDTFLIDVKHTDADAYREHTGGNLRVFLENLDALCENGGRLRFRFPLIPGVNDSPLHLDGVVALYWRYAACVEAVDVIPYHVIGTGKAARFGDETEPVRFQEPDSTEVDAVRASLSSRGVPVEGVS